MNLKRSLPPSLAAAFCLIFSAGLFAESRGADAEHWYRTSYAPLWAGDTWDQMDELTRHFSPTVTTRGLEGEVAEVDAGEWLAGAVAQWKSEGWLGSELASLETREINPTTVSFIARWHDRYADGSSSQECGWYLADLVEGEWRISEYADANCEE